MTNGIWGNGVEDGVHGEETEEQNEEEGNKAQKTCT